MVLSILVSSRRGHASGHEVSCLQLGRASFRAPWTGLGREGWGCNGGVSVVGNAKLINNMYRYVCNK